VASALPGCYYQFIDWTFEIRQFSFSKKYIENLLGEELGPEEFTFWKTKKLSWWFGWLLVLKLIVYKRQTGRIKK
jgi:hypothetical protein